MGRVFKWERLGIRTLISAYETDVMPFHYRAVAVTRIELVLNPYERPVMPFHYTAEGRTGTDPA